MSFFSDRVARKTPERLLTDYEIHVFMSVKYANKDKTLEIANRCAHHDAAVEILRYLRCAFDVEPILDLDGKSKCAKPYAK